MLLYHFTSLEFGLQNIEKQRLKVSTIDNLNDPFELLCYESGDPEFRRKLRAWKKNEVGKLGILCFSKSYRSPLQWAHYGDRHRGVCLGYEVDDEIANPINYIETMISSSEVDFSSEKGIESFLDNLYTTKMSDWSYEEEYRVFGDLGRAERESGLYFHKLDGKIKLREVVFGMVFDSKSEHLFKDAVGCSGAVGFYKVRPGFKKYMMVKDKSWRGPRGSYQIISQN